MPNEYGNIVLNNVGEMIRTDIVKSKAANVYSCGKNFLPIMYAKLTINKEEIKPKKYKIFKFMPKILNKKALNK